MLKGITLIVLKCLIKILSHITCFRISVVIIVIFSIFVAKVWKHYQFILAQKYEESLMMEPMNAKYPEYPVMVFWTHMPFAPMEDQLLQCPNNIKCNTIHYFDRFRPTTVHAYVMYGSMIHIENLPYPRRGDRIIWALLHEESPRNLIALAHEQFLKLFNFSTTFSRYSNFGFPMQEFSTLENITSRKYFVETAKKNTYNIAPVVYLASNCQSTNSHQRFIKELMKYIRIDSYGACLKNKLLPESLRRDYLNRIRDDDVMRFLAPYKFMITFENGVCKDYITEKLWRALELGVVPIYVGSETVRDWLPHPRAAVLPAVGQSPRRLAARLRALAADTRLYEKYLVHKTHGRITNKRLIKEVKDNNHTFSKKMTPFLCFVCEKLHNKNLFSETHIVTKKHHDCPKPTAFMTNREDESNLYLHEWRLTSRVTEMVYKMSASNIDLEQGKQLNMKYFNVTASKQQYLTDRHTTPQPDVTND